MAWLGTWQNRIKIEIDYTKVDSDLSDFPTLVPISISAGKDNQNISAVFDELGSDANRKKIAVTTFNGTTQCYVEIERWDDANEKAELHVKIPSVSSASDTILYLYYDVSQVDNTTYVGDTTSIPAQNVWNSDFKLVMHMAQDPNGDVADAIKDSTSNANHGTPAGSMTSADLVDGKIGKCIDFDGSNDYLNLGDLSQVEGSGELTLENIVKVTSFPTSNHYIVGKYGASGTPVYADRSFVFSVLSTGVVYFGSVNTAGTNIYRAITSSVLSTGTYYYVAGVTKANVLQKVFIDNNEAAYSTQEVYPADQTIRANSEPAYISKYGDGTYHWHGPLDEIRVSIVARSTAWLKTTYHSSWDNLISFGDIEHIPIDLSTEIAAGSESIQDLNTDIQVNTESFFDLQTEISAATLQIILDLDTEIAAAFNISFEDLITDIQVAAELLTDLDTEIITKAQIVSDLNTDIRAMGFIFYDLNTDIQVKKPTFYDLNTEIAVIRSKYWLDTEIEALSYARWSFNTEWNPNRFLNTEIAAKKPYEFSFKTKTGSSYVASTSEIEILLSGYSWPLRTLFLDYLRVGTSNVYKFELWWARGQSGKNPLKNAKIKAEYTNTSYAGGYEVVNCDWLSVKIDGRAPQTVNATPLDLGDMPCDSKLDIELTVDCRDCSLSRGLIFFRLIITGDYKEAIYGAPIVYGDGTQYFEGEQDDYESNNFICRLYVV